MPVPALTHELVVPVPSIAVHGIVGEPVQVRGASEVGDEHNGVVGAGLGTAPQAERNGAEFVAAALQSLKHRLEVGAHLARPRGQETERVVKANTQMKNQEGSGGRDVAEIGGERARNPLVFFDGERELGGYTTWDDTLLKRIGIEAANLEYSGDEGATKDESHW